MLQLEPSSNETDHRQTSHLRAARKERRESFNSGFNDLMQTLRKGIQELALKHDKREKEVEDLIFNGGERYLKENKTNAWNAWSHSKFEEVNGSR